MMFMKFTNTPQAVIYMLRHYLTANINDPLSNESRGYSDYKQYFLTEATEDQILYLEREPVTNGKFELKLDGIVKIKNVDYEVTGMQVKLLGTPLANKTVEVNYDCVKQWIYDDHPNLNSGSFPRITIDALPSTFETTQVGEYHNYNSAHGNLVRAKFKIIIRHRQSINWYDYYGDKYKNYDLVNAITDKIVRYFKENKQNSLWKFRTFDVDNIQRITTEEDSGILRNDIDLEVIYFHNGCD